MAKTPATACVLLYDPNDQVNRPSSEKSSWNVDAFASAVHFPVSGAVGGRNDAAEAGETPYPTQSVSSDIHDGSSGRLWLSDS